MLHRLPQMNTGARLGIVGLSSLGKIDRAAVINRLFWTASMDVEYLNEPSSERRR